MPENARRRPRRLIILACVLVPLALLLVSLTWVVLEVRAVSAAQPVVAVNYREQFRDHAKAVAGVDGETADRAWSLLVEAVEKSEVIHREYDRELDEAHTSPRFDGDSFVADYLYIRDAIDISPDMEREWEAIRRLQAAGVFESLARFTEISPGIAPAGDNAVPILFEVQPWMASSRHLTRARIASMRLAHSQGDLEDVARGFDETLAIGRTIVNSPSVIWTMVGTAIQAAAIQEARHLLMEGGLDPDTCGAMLQSLERHALPPHEFGVEAERAAMLDLLQRIYSDDGKGDGHLAPQGVAPTLGGSASGLDGLNFITALRARFFMQTRRETTEVLNRWFDVHVAPVPDEAYRRLESYLDSGENLIASLIAPALGHHVRNSRVLRLDADGLRLMLMLEVHRQRHGSLPATLDDLDSAFEPPIDPFSNEPLRYRLLADDPHGRPYLLYSVGADRQDDGGRDVEDGADRTRVLSNHPRYHGSDYIINPPRLGVRR